MLIKLPFVSSAEQSSELRTQQRAINARNQLVQTDGTVNRLKESPFYRTTRLFRTHYVASDPSRLFPLPRDSRLGRGERIAPRDGRKKKGRDFTCEDEAAGQHPSILWSNPSLTPGTRGERRRKTTTTMHACDRRFSRHPGPLGIRNLRRRRVASSSPSLSFSSSSSSATCTTRGAGTWWPTTRTSSVSRCRRRCWECTRCIRGARLV